MFDLSVFTDAGVARADGWDGGPVRRMAANAIIAYSRKKCLLSASTVAPVRRRRGAAAPAPAADPFNANGCGIFFFDLIFVERNVLTPIGSTDNACDNDSAAWFCGGKHLIIVIIVVVDSASYPATCRRIQIEASTDRPIDRLTDQSINQLPGKLLIN